MRAYPRGIAVAVALLVATRAHADDAALDKARQALDDLDYPTAQKTLADTLAAGNNDPEELVEIYKLTGIVAGSLGDAKAATEAFKHLLVLSPKAKLPAGTSPKINKPFTTASEWFKKSSALQVEVETANKPASVTLAIENDPLAMVASARVEFVVDGGNEQSLDGKGDKTQIKIDLPKGKRIDLRLVALDAHGNRLVELGTRAVPIVITSEPDVVVVQQSKPTGPPKVAPAKAGPSRPWYFKWWLWTGVAVGFGGATTYFAIEARSDADELQKLIDQSISHRVGESQDLEDRVRREVLFTNIGLGATVVFAAGAAILYFTEPSGPEPRNVTITPTPIPGGGAIVLEGGF